MLALVVSGNFSLGHAFQPRDRANDLHGRGNSWLLGDDRARHQWPAAVFGPLRIGYAVAGPEAVARLETPRTSDGLNVVSSRAAVAALGDSEYVRVSRIRNADDRQEFFNQSNARMVRWIDSQTNFVMIKPARPATDVVAHFEGNQILLPAPYAGYEDYVRVALGTPAQIQEFWARSGI